MTLQTVKKFSAVLTTLAMEPPYWVLKTNCVGDVT